MAGLAMTMPVGSGSLTCALVNASVLELVRRIVTVERPPDDTFDGLKLLVAPNADVYVKVAVFVVTGVTLCVVPSPNVCVPLTVAVFG